MNNSIHEKVKFLKVNCYVSIAYITNLRTLIKDTISLQKKIHVVYLHKFFQGITTFAQTMFEFLSSL